ncbi:Putative transposable element [Caligus rogercresseyi]|uniref:Transposable element n=1 Tax=Caligus rogercresseyi TaxID=217165 RepID=A0A7T8GT77_CALRO|nr:Putative transposable element [Caligus rogercresseyi]
MEAKRQRVADLLHAQVKVIDIMEIVKCGKTLVYDVKKKLETGKGLKRKMGSGGHNRKVDEDFLMGLMAEIEADPQVFEVSEWTIRKAVSKLGLRQLLSNSAKNSRVDRGKKLLSWLKKKPSSTKNWTVDQSRNARNDRFLAYAVEEHPASSMMLGVVASDGKRMPPFWFPQGLRVGAKEYLAVIKNVVKPWLDATYPKGNYCYQQDGAPGHKAKKPQKWCKDNLMNFWPAHFWPPSSPDVAPLDYGIWGFVESKACATPHPSVDALKASVEKEWADMSEHYVRKVCRAFRPRFEAMVSAEGSHFEN